MTLANPFSTKTDGVSTITAAEVNSAGAMIAQAVDGTGGGDYTPVGAPIRIGGAQGLRILSGGFLTILSGGTLSVPSGGIVSAEAGSSVTLAGTNVISGGTTISGATTASDLTMTGTNKVKLASRSITRVQTAHFWTTDATIWSITQYGNAFQLTSSGDTISTSCPIRPPHGAVITAVSVYVDPAAHVALPGNMPRFRLEYVDFYGTVTTVGTGVDNSADFTSYGAQHAITLSGLSQTVDRTTQRYSIIFLGEGGANFVAGLKVGSIALTYTITAYDED